MPEISEAEQKAAVNPNDRAFRMSPLAAVLVMGAALAGGIDSWRKAGVLHPDLQLSRAAGALFAPMVICLVLGLLSFYIAGKRNRVGNLVMGVSGAAFLATNLHSMLQ